MAVGVDVPVVIAGAVSDLAIQALSQDNSTDVVECLAAADVIGRLEARAMVQVIQDFIPLGRKNRPGHTNPMKYITIHNTGNSNRGAGAKSHAEYLKGDSAAGEPVSWHYTVDDSIIYQHLSDNETAYHAGDGSGPGNTQSIGIEICDNGDSDLLKATENTVELVAYLCLKRNIPKENIVQHYKWSSKDCPYQLRRNKPYSWDTFIEHVEKAISESTEEPTPEPPPKTPEEITVENAIANGTISERAYWLGVLNGTITANPLYMKIAMDNAHRKLQTRTPKEKTVDNAIVDGIITERVYWQGVLDGTIRANPGYVKIVFDNIHKKLQS